jgi:3',5'-nucleoside bisphosphate phosphatase
LGKADLHTHTTASDGALAPGDLLRKARQKGLKTLAITDHDTIKGYLEARPVADELGIELLPGVEITALWEKREIHLLAYMFNPEHPGICDLLVRHKVARVNRMKGIVRSLNKKGLDIDYDEIRAESRTGNVGRPHAAAVLIRKGYVRGKSEAFIRYLSTEKLGEVQTNYTGVADVVKTVRQAGGVLSLAHPGPLYSADEVDELVEYGLDGLECIHPSHNFNVQRTFTKLAKTRNLLVTGGSDYHGTGRSDYDPYFGIVTVGNQYVSALKRLSARRQTS